MVKRTSVFDLWSQKGKKKWPQTHIDNAKEAEAAYQAGIEIISCEPDHHFKEVRKVAPTAFLSVGLRHGSVSSPQEAIKYGFEILEIGADAVYCSHSIYFIEAMAKEGIPITSHVGLVPNLSTWTNFRAVGKTAEEALQVCQKVKDLESAGAACVEVEVVPIEVADHITKNTKRAKIIAHPNASKQVGTGPNTSENILKHQKIDRFPEKNREKSRNLYDFDVLA